MTTEFSLFSQIKEGRYYNLITFNNGIRMVDVQLGKTSNTNIKETIKLGKLVEIRQHGRPYDPDITLYFEDETGERFSYDPLFGSVEAYVEYELDTEEKSMIRIQERTRVLEDETLGNDWALRPENVVATQGIDLSNWNQDN
jgi:hypothetical protein